jgi:hypothetical protein
MADMYTNKFSDNFRTFKSKVMTYATLTDASTLYNVVRLPRFALVTNVHLLVNTAFNGTTPVMTVGWATSTDALADAFLTNVEAAIDAAGYKVPLAGTNINAGGKYFATSSGRITVTVDPDTSTAGEMILFGTYSVIV